MKKILILILLTAICCSCDIGVSYRDDDRFVVKGVTLWSDKYRYKYTLYHINNGELYYVTPMYSNEKYELNDTLRLMK